MHPSVNDAVPSLRGSSRLGVRASWPIILSLLLAPLAATVWFLMVGTDPLPIDEWWYDTITITEHSPLFAIAHAFHVIGSTRIMTLIGVALTVIPLLARRVRDAAAVATTMLGVAAIASGLKLLVGRPRPQGMLVEQLETSFPSGHSLGSAALMTIVVCLIVVHSSHRWLHVVSVCIGLIVVLTMMWSRAALHVHWLSDTVCGALIGVALALTVARCIATVPTHPL